MEITKETMGQYEFVRQTGVTDMFDYYQVIRIANACDLNSLGQLTRDEYINLLQNFSRLMKTFGVTQDEIPMATQIRKLQKECST